MESITTYKKKFPQEIYSWCKAIDEKFSAIGCFELLKIWADWFVDHNDEEAYLTISKIVEYKYIPYMYDFGQYDTMREFGEASRILYGWYDSDGTGCPCYNTGYNPEFIAESAYLPNNIFYHMQENPSWVPKCWCGKYSKTPSDAYLKLIVVWKEILVCNTT